MLQFQPKSPIEPETAYHTIYSQLHTASEKHENTLPRIWYRYFKILLFSAIKSLFGKINNHNKIIAKYRVTNIKAVPKSRPRVSRTLWNICVRAFCENS